MIERRCDLIPSDLYEWRCRACRKLLGYIHGKARCKCPRCHEENTLDTEIVLREAP